MKDLAYNIINKIKLFLKDKKILIIFILITFTIIYNMDNSLYNQPKQICFSENFDENIDSWESLDAEWIPQDNEKLGVAKLIKKQYAAPYLMRKLNLEETPPENFTLSFRVKIKEFTNEAVTLLALIFPTGELSIVMNQEGYIGISKNLFEIPTYSSNNYARLPNNKWGDIILQINKEKASLYVNEANVLNINYESSYTPLLEIWLGAIWLNGGGKYGAPIDISYDSIIIGNDTLLPKTSFTTNLFKKIFGKLF